ncbi:subtilisin-like protein [Ceratobasidium sp. AG-I]|nr:subtilisin-like protein [Ceratobasidium sp. AG-I]
MAAPLQLFKLDGPVRPNSYIVKLKGDVPTSDHRNLINDPQVPLNPSCIKHEYHEEVFKGYAATLSDEELEYLLNCGHVESVTEDGLCTTLVVPNDSYEVVQHDFPQEDREARLQDSEGVDVYGIDTGIFIEHSCFEGRASWGANFTEDGDNDGNGHGTHTAGTAVGRDFGQATSAKIIAVKVLGDDGSGAFSQVIAGISWAVQQAQASGRPSVATMSLGGPANPPLDTAIRNAINRGLSFAVAAGNENQDANNTSPARVPEANTVGAVDNNNKKARFSNFGSPLKVWAPGVGILSAWIDGPNSAKKLDGTSMATPRVAGYMAVALGKESIMPPNLTEQLKKNAKPVVTGAPTGTTNLLAQRWGFQIASAKVLGKNQAKSKTDCYTRNSYSDRIANIPVGLVKLGAQNNVSRSSKQKVFKNYMLLPKATAAPRIAIRECRQCQTH